MGGGGRREAALPEYPTPKKLNHTYLPYQRVTSARTRARPPALSPALGSSTRIPRFRRGALGGGRVTERVRHLTARPISESWGWQPWVGAARKNVVGVVRRLVGTKM